MDEDRNRQDMVAAARAPAGALTSTPISAPQEVSSPTSDAPVAAGERVVDQNTGASPELASSANPSSVNPPPANRDAPADSLLGRLEQLLTEEKHALEASKFEQLPDIAAQKHRLLAQLSHFRGDSAEIVQNNITPDEITKIRSMLDENMKLLKFRMDAINELTQTMEEAIRNAESDGTYSL